MGLDTVSGFGYGVNLGDVYNLTSNPNITPEFLVEFFDLDDDSFEEAKSFYTKKVEDESSWLYFVREVFKENKFLYYGEFGDIFCGVDLEDYDCDNLGDFSKAYYQENERVDKICRILNLGKPYLHSFAFVW